jgi:hypothetical protein
MDIHQAPPHGACEPASLAAQLGVRETAAGYRAVVVKVSHRQPGRGHNGLAIDKVVQKQSAPLGTTAATVRR